MKFSESLLSSEYPGYKKFLLSLVLFILILFVFFLVQFPFFFSVPLFLYYPLWDKKNSFSHFAYWLVFGFILDSAAGYHTAHTSFYFLFIYLFNILAYRFIFIDTWRAAVILGTISHILLFVFYYFLYPGTAFYSIRLINEFVISLILFTGSCLLVYPLLARRIDKRFL